MTIITGILSLLIIFIHKLNDSLKLKLFMVVFNSIISQVIILNIIFFSYIENTRIGIILTILFFIILSFDKKKIKEEFISYYKKY
jgi:hypothetical protein